LNFTPLFFRFYCFSFLPSFSGGLFFPGFFVTSVIFSKTSATDATDPACGGLSKLCSASFPPIVFGAFSETYQSFLVLYFPLTKQKTCLKPVFFLSSLSTDFPPLIRIFPFFFWPLSAALFFFFYSCSVANTQSVFIPGPERLFGTKAFLPPCNPWGLSHFLQPGMVFFFFLAPRPFSVSFGLAPGGAPPRDHLFSF